MNSRINGKVCNFLDNLIIDEVISDKDNATLTTILKINEIKYVVKYMTRWKALIIPFFKFSKPNGKLLKLMFDKLLGISYY